MRLKFYAIVLFFHLFALSVFSQEFYDPLHIPKIELTFAEKNWEYPLHYYHSLNKGDRHVGHAVIDGVPFDSIGVRFKGFSSYNRKNKKNPMNIKLDHIRKKADHQKYETIKLSNGLLDPSWLREVLAYRIARKYMVAPQSNYAEVFVNGKYYGLFGNTESVDGKFADRYFYADKKNVLIKGNSPLGPFSGKRSSLEYLGTDTTAYSVAYELKSDYGWGELFKLVDILNNRPKEIETILNMDNAIWMLAFNNVLVNLDSYSDFQQNYYLSQDNHGRFSFILWDVNLAFDGLGKPKGIVKQPGYDPLAKKDDKRFPLINIVLNNPKYRKIYFAHCRTILKENFANNWYKEEAEKYRALIRDAVERDINWKFNISAFDKNFTETYVMETSAPFPYPGITELMNERAASLNNHYEYKKQPPSITDMEVNIFEKDSSIVKITAIVSDAQTVSVFYRKNKKELFQETIMDVMNIKSGEKAESEIYTAFIPIDKKKVEFYIYAENKEAVIFSPERAEHEFYIFKKEEELPF